MSTFNVSSSAHINAHVPPQQRIQSAMNSATPVALPSQPNLRMSSFHARMQEIQNIYALPPGTQPKPDEQLEIQASEEVGGGAAASVLKTFTCFPRLPAGML